MLACGGVQMKPCFLMLAASGLIANAGSAQTPASAPRLPAAETAQIFKAAGAVRRGKAWTICTDDPKARATIDEIRDINGDGRPDAIISESGLFCHGNTGTGYTILSKQGDGRWVQITSSTGIPEFLKTKGVGGWPDISIGGPGFCFPVVRWNGREYGLNRREYQGKRCK